MRPSPCSPAGDAKKPKLEGGSEGGAKASASLPAPGSERGGSEGPAGAEPAAAEKLGAAAGEALCLAFRYLDRTGAGYIK